MDGLIRRQTTQVRRPIDIERGHPDEGDECTAEEREKPRFSLLAEINQLYTSTSISPSQHAVVRCVQSCCRAGSSWLSKSLSSSSLCCFTRVRRSISVLTNFLRGPHGFLSVNVADPDDCNAPLVDSGSQFIEDERESHALSISSPLTTDTILDEESFPSLPFADKSLIIPKHRRLVDYTQSIAELPINPPIHINFAVDMNQSALASSGYETDSSEEIIEMLPLGGEEDPATDPSTKVRFRLHVPRDHRETPRTQHSSSMKNQFIPSLPSVLTASGPTTKVSKQSSHCSRSSSVDSTSSDISSPLRNGKLAAPSFPSKLNREASDRSASTPRSILSQSLSFPGKSSSVARSNRISISPPRRCGLHEGDANRSSVSPPRRFKIHEGNEITVPLKDNISENTNFSNSVHNTRDPNFHISQKNSDREKHRIQQVSDERESFDSSIRTMSTATSTDSRFHQTRRKRMARRGSFAGVSKIERFDGSRNNPLPLSKYSTAVDSIQVSCNVATTSHTGRIRLSRRGSFVAGRRAEHLSEASSRNGKLSASSPREVSNVGAK